MQKKKQTQTGTSRAGKIGLLLYCAVFIGACMMPIFGWLFGLDSPNLEKRRLAQQPSWLEEGKVNLAFTSQFDAYFSDQFIFRSWLISGWHTLNQILLQRSGSSRVLAGEDGWLYYQDTLDDYLGDPVLDPISLRRLDRVLILQQEWLANQGIPFLFVVAPNKNTIYPDPMPDRYHPIQADGNLERWMNLQKGIDQIDLAAILRDNTRTSDPLTLYHRSDSHWNNIGAAWAADAMMAAMQAHLPELDTSSLASQNWQPQQDWLGDLAVMLYPSGPLPDWQYYSDSPGPFRYSRPIKSLEDIKIQTTAKDGRYHLLMFRDSFANALIPMLSPRFAQVTYSRAIPYDYSLVGDQTKAAEDGPQVDLVVLEIVERNLPQLLQSPPRMPASLITADLSAELIRSFAEAGIVADAQPAPEATVTGELDQDWLKLTGVWHDQSSSSTIDRVVIGFTDLTDLLKDGPIVNTGGHQAVFLEAFPICNAEDLQEAVGADQPTDGLPPDGFTLYLKSGQWNSGTQDLVVTCHDLNSWKTTVLRITLP